LLTSHTVRTLTDAERIVGFYRRRWTIEQVFRTLETRGFDIEALRIRDDEPFEELAMAALIAAITIMQLVHERDGAARRPLRDAFDAGDDAFLRHLCASLEGKTEKQTPPRFPRLRRMGLREARRVELLLRKTRTNRHVQRTRQIPEPQTRLDTPGCVNPVGLSLRPQRIPEHDGSDDKHGNRPGSLRLTIFRICG